MLIRFQRLRLRQIEVAASFVVIASLATAFLEARPAQAQSSALPPPALSQGQQVVGVRVVTDRGEVVQNNPAALPLQPGHPFDLDAERASLRQLFRSGNYADIEAEAFPEDGGIRLDFQRSSFKNMRNRLVTPVGML